MNIEISATRQELGSQSALHAAKKINEAVNANGTANIILATGTSQFDTLEHLVTMDIDWSEVVMFHLDEYAGLPQTHPASFRKYLQERFVEKVPGLKAVHFIHGDHHNLDQEIRRLNRVISDHPVDVALVGIGENGHLAFNDPPADFATEDPFIVVELDKACRRQQMGEGWFDTLEEVPGQAVSMTVKQIMKSKCIICSVPDKRKAIAVKNCIEGEVSNRHPASVLQKHDTCTIYLDADSAFLLSDMKKTP